MIDEKRIIWTRSKEDWDSDRSLFEDVFEDVFKERTTDFIHLPCIRTSAVSGPEIPRLPYDRHIVASFGSAKAVKFAMDCPALLAILKRVKEFYCVGEKTAQALKDANLQQKNYLDHIGAIRRIKWTNMESMARAMAAEIPKDSIVVSPGPKIRSFDAHSWFSENKIEHHRIDLYETKTGLRNYRDEHLVQKDIQELQATLHGVVCFASPSAVLGFSKYLDPNNNGLSAQLIAVAIGESTLEVALDHFTECHVSANQTTESLLRKAKAVL